MMEIDAAFVRYLNNKLN